MCRRFECHGSDDICEVFVWQYVVVKERQHRNELNVKSDSFVRNESHRRKDAPDIGGTFMDEKTKAEIEAGVPIVILHWDENRDVTSKEAYNLENISLSK